MEFPLLPTILFEQPTKSIPICQLRGRCISLKALGEWGSGLDTGICALSWKPECTVRGSVIFLASCGNLTWHRTVVTQKGSSSLAIAGAFKCDIAQWLHEIKKKKTKTPCNVMQNQVPKPVSEAAVPGSRVQLARPAPTWKAGSALRSPPLWAGSKDSFLLLAGQSTEPRQVTPEQAYSWAKWSLPDGNADSEPREWRIKLATEGRCGQPSGGLRSVLSLVLSMTHSTLQRTLRAAASISEKGVVLGSKYVVATHP